MIIEKFVRMYVKMINDKFRDEVIIGIIIGWLKKSVQNISETGLSQLNRLI